MNTDYFSNATNLIEVVESHADYYSLTPARNQELKNDLFAIMSPENLESSLSNSVSFISLEQDGCCEACYSCIFRYEIGDDEFSIIQTHEDDADYTVNLSVSVF